MYQRKKYLKTDQGYIFDFIQTHPFATFILNGEGLLATHVPILVEGTAENFRLFGHIAYNNEQYSHIRDGLEVLLVFQGANAYVSSSWYYKKEVPTWDYSAVHINAKLVVQSEKELENSLEKLVAHFEKDQENPLYYSNIPTEIVKPQLPLITGFWCEPFKIQAIAKLHQGFEKADIDSITERLSKKENPMEREVSRQIKTEHGKNH